MYMNMGPGKRAFSYTIKSGDTLYSISKRFRVPLYDILMMNPCIDIYNLQIGERICIPYRHGVNMQEMDTDITDETIDE